MSSFRYGMYSMRAGNRPSASGRNRSAASRTPSRMGIRMFRSIRVRYSGSDVTYASSASQPPKPIADQVDPQSRAQDRETREGGDPPGGREVVPAVGEHVAPARHGGGHGEPGEA